MKSSTFKWIKFVGVGNLELPPIGSFKQCERKGKYFVRNGTSLWLECKPYPQQNLVL